ncbi:MAG: helix-turn-helix transcriptional regulator [Oscillospiraceae bacterium]|nr:helix-turn-helix transcriptional regulator [Oscillospiraceae bacterium]
MKLNEKLQKLRKERGLSQEQLAEMLAVSRQAVSKWETGEAMPETDKLVRLADRLHVSLDELLRESVEKTDTRGHAAAVSTGGIQMPKMMEVPVDMPAMVRWMAWTVLAIGCVLIFCLSADGSHFAWWPLDRMVWGAMLQVLGIGFYCMISRGLSISQAERCRFWAISVWLLAPIVFLVAARFIDRLFPLGSFVMLLILVPLAAGLCSILCAHFVRSAKLLNIEKNND